MANLIAVDIFAGAGGLSLGAGRAGFKIPVAVEIDPGAAATYRKNLRYTKVLEHDVRGLTGSELLDRVPNRQIDLLMGCAPCQGFCSLTLKAEREDPRNTLVTEFARLVRETLPDAVLMENVSGLALRGEHLLSQFIETLRSAGYITNWWNVQMADYGVPQNRRRLVLLAGRGFSIDLPKPTHARVSAGTGLKSWRTVRNTIGKEKAAKTLSLTSPRGPRSENWHIVRDLHPKTKARLRATSPGEMRNKLAAELLPRCHQDGYDGFRNVYMRMSWDYPSPTITAGCTTPAKGRFGHPDRRRTTISVREAAMLQTFPKSFRFETDKIELACQLIGNAVPPIFAERLAEAVRDAIYSHRAKVATKR